MASMDQKPSCLTKLTHNSPQFSILESFPKINGSSKSTKAQMQSIHVFRRSAISRIKKKNIGRKRLKLKPGDSKRQKKQVKKLKLKIQSNSRLSTRKVFWLEHLDNSTKDLNSQEIFCQKVLKVWEASFLRKSNELRINKYQKIQKII